MSCGELQPDGDKQPYTQRVAELAAIEMESKFCFLPKPLSRSIADTHRIEELVRRELYEQTAES